jgi:hypothetical protein
MYVSSSILTLSNVNSLLYFVPSVQKCDDIRVYVGAKSSEIETSKEKTVFDNLSLVIVSHYASLFLFFFFPNRSLRRVLVPMSVYFSKEICLKKWQEKKKIYI